MSVKLLGDKCKEECNCDMNCKHWFECIYEGYQPLDEQEIEGKDDEI